MENRRARAEAKTAEGHTLVADAGQLEQSQRAAVSRAIRDEDSFTLFYELAYSQSPVSSEALSRMFGANLGYVSSVLSRLQRLGIVSKRERGGGWQVRDWAAAALKSLEQALENFQLDVQETRSTATETSLRASSADSATYDGLWMGSFSTLQTTHLKRQSGHGETATFEGKTAKFGPAEPDRGQNETRSHDYQ